MPQTTPLYRAYRPYAGNRQSLNRPTLADLYRQQPQRDSSFGERIGDWAGNFAGSTVANLFGQIPDYMSTYLWRQNTGFKVTRPSGKKPDKSRYPVAQWPARTPRSFQVPDEVPIIPRGSGGARDQGPPSTTFFPVPGARATRRSKIRSYVRYELNK